MTEDQHIKLVAVGDDFWNEFGDFAAKYVALFPKEIEDEVIDYLQDKCSIHGSIYKSKVAYYRSLD